MDSFNSALILKLVIIREKKKEIWSLISRLDQNIVKMGPEKEGVTQLAAGEVWKFISLKTWPTILWTEELRSCDKNLHPLWGCLPTHLDTDNFCQCWSWATLRLAPKNEEGGFFVFLVFLLVCFLKPLRWEAAVTRSGLRLTFWGKEIKILCPWCSFPAAGIHSWSQG